LTLYNQKSAVSKRMRTVTKSVSKQIRDLQAAQKSVEGY